MAGGGSAGSLKLRTRLWATTDSGKYRHEEKCPGDKAVGHFFSLHISRARRFSTTLDFSMVARQKNSTAGTQALKQDVTYKGLGRLLPPNSFVTLCRSTATDRYGATKTPQTTKEAAYHGVSLIAPYRFALHLFGGVLIGGDNVFLTAHRAGIITA